MIELDYDNIKVGLKIKFIYNDNANKKYWNKIGKIKEHNNHALTVAWEDGSGSWSCAIRAYASRTGAPLFEILYDADAPPKIHSCYWCHKENTHRTQSCWWCGVEL